MIWCTKAPHPTFPMTGAQRWRAPILASADCKRVRQSVWSEAITDAGKASASAAPSQNLLAMDLTQP